MGGILLAAKPNKKCEKLLTKLCYEFIMSIILHDCNNFSSLINNHKMTIHTIMGY